MTTLNIGDSLPAELSSTSTAGARFRIFYFMRTAECPVCRNHVKRLVALGPVLARAGAEVIVLAPDETAPPWAAALPYPLRLGSAAYLAAGFGRTFNAIQQSGTIVADGAGKVLAIWRATLPFLALDERALLRLLDAAPAPVVVTASL
jgi:hypothetical protein